MDSQLHRILGGRRPPLKLTSVDLLEVARGIAALVRNRARTITGTQRGRSFVRIWGYGIDVLVFAEDWNLIAPYLTDGTFSPLLVPVESGFKTFDPVTRFSSTHNDVTDPLVSRVHLTLRTLFPTQVPT